MSDNLEPDYGDLASSLAVRRIGISDRQPREVLGNLGGAGVLGGVLLSPFGSGRAIPEVSGWKAKGLITVE